MVIGTLFLRTFLIGRKEKVSSYPGNVSQSEMQAALYAAKQNPIWQEFMDVGPNQPYYPLCIAYTPGKYISLPIKKYVQAVDFLYKNIESYVVFFRNKEYYIYDNFGVELEKDTAMWTKLKNMYTSKGVTGRTFGGSNSKAKWIATGQKTTIDGKLRALYACTSNPGEVRIRKMRKGRDGKVKATYVKHEVAQKTKKGRG